MTKITTTFEPGKVIDVDEAELLDLTRQGLVNSHVEGAAPTAPEPAEATADAVTDAEEAAEAATEAPSKKGAK